MLFRKAIGQTFMKQIIYSHDLRDSKVRMRSKVRRLKNTRFRSSPHCSYLALVDRIRYRVKDPARSQAMANWIVDDAMFWTKIAFGSCGCRNVQVNAASKVG